MLLLIFIAVYNDMFVVLQFLFHICYFFLNFINCYHFSHVLLTPFIAFSKTFLTDYVVLVPVTRALSLQPKVHY